MQLKSYQENTLNVLQRFFERARIEGHEHAYYSITKEPEIRQRVGAFANSYTVWGTIPNTPRVCLKIPTGGGKTIVGAHAIRIVSETWQDKKYPFVLWIVPSDTIRLQTSEALKNPRHPYRQAIDEQFGGKVQVFDLDEKFNIRPDDIENNACIVVSTIQAFRQSKTDKYSVYKTNENLEDHFQNVKTEGMELDESGKAKLSFANLLYRLRPIIIVDEAHNAITGLSVEMQGRLNPSAIIELTATPRGNNNTLYSVRAKELKDEEMIKLPIALKEHNNWELAVADAIIKREELEKAAENEVEYIRPIILFQAQPKDEDITVEKLKAHLMGVHNIPESQIAIATGEQKELDGVNVFDKKCPIKYIITVEALKEGWDCSFAYVLCSLANVKSDTAIEQLLGRVMRMPYARTRKIRSLNEAYAFVLSQHFGEAAGDIVEKLKNRGFDDVEAEEAVQKVPNPDLFGRSETNKVSIKTPIAPHELPKSMSIEHGADGSTALVFTAQTTAEEVAEVIKKIEPAAREELKWKFGEYSYAKNRQGAAVPSKSQTLIVPSLMAYIQGELELADMDNILSSIDWDFEKYAKWKLDAGEFEIIKQGQGFSIDIDGNRLKYSQCGEDQTVMPFIDVESWTVKGFVADMDRMIRQSDLPQSESLKWVRKIVDYLIEVRGFPLSALVLSKFVLKNKLIAIITEARKKFRKDSYDEFLLNDSTRKVELDFNNGFKFRDDMYADIPSLSYRGSYIFSKHFLGADRVADFDGGAKGEEFQCAKAIDLFDEVDFWLRNAARHSNSFYLPTSTDKFYPDFICKLKDGRILVVEYKGDMLRNPDTKEKEDIGEVWEKSSNGKCLFMIAYKSENGLNTAEQIKKKIGTL